MIVLFACDFLPSVFAVNHIVNGLKPVADRIIVVRSPTTPVKHKVPAPPEYGFWCFELYQEVIQPMLAYGGDDHGQVRTLESLQASSEVELVDVGENLEEVGLALSSNAEFRGAVAVRFNRLFGGDFVNTLRGKGFFWNIHGGRIPSYRGLMNIYHMALHNEAELGWSLQELVADVDRGDLLQYCSIRSSGEPAILATELKLAKGMSGIVCARIAFGHTEFQTHRHNQDGGRYYSNLDPDELAALRKKGKFVCDLKTFDDVIIRGFCPPGSTLYSSVFDAVHRRTRTRGFLESVGGAVI